MARRESAEKSIDGEDISPASVSTEEASINNDAGFTVGTNPSESHCEVRQFDITGSTSPLSTTINDIPKENDRLVKLFISESYVVQDSTTNTNNFTVSLTGSGIGDGDYQYLLEDEGGSNIKRTGEDGWVLLETTAGTIGDRDIMAGRWSILSSSIMGNGVGYRRNEGRALNRGWGDYANILTNPYELKVTIDSSLSDTDISTTTLTGAVLISNPWSDV